MSLSPPWQPPQPPPPPPDSSSSLARLIRSTLSYDTNVMLAAIISLLLVILFVLLLHLYTRWFLLQARRRSRTSVTVPRVLGSRLHQRFTIIDASNSDNSNAKFGLPIAIISSLPLFVYNFSSIEDRDHGLDCAICLCVFEEEEIGRRLPACGHAFHVECIDMWLQSHSTCPICRATIQYNQIRKIDNISDTEIVDSGLNLNILTVSNEEDLRLEIVTTVSDHNQILEPCESDVVAMNESVTCGSSSSSSTGESELPKNLLTISSRSGSKVHPSSSIVNHDESEA